MADYSQGKIYQLVDGECNIQLIEEFPCERKGELLKREGQIQLQLRGNGIDLINERVAGRTQKEYYEQNSVQILERNKQYYEKNREQMLEQQKLYREQNLAKIQEQQKKFREQNREKISEYQKKYYEENKEQVLANVKAHREANQEAIKARKNKKVPCPNCGKEITRNNMSRHRKTHLK